MSDLVLFRSANHWLSDKRLSQEIQKMNAWASAIQRKKLSGERIANLEKMSECPALLFIRLLVLKICVGRYFHNHILPRNLDLNEKSNKIHDKKAILSRFLMKI